MNDSRWVEVSFSCHDLASWAIKDLDVGREQPWIWAFNINQSFNEATEESSLAKHHHHGYFSLQMMTHSLEGETDGPIIPSIDTSLHNDGGNDGEFETQNSSLVVRTHGSLMILGLMIFYPCGALTIRSGFKRSFEGHLFFQSLASVCCLAGATLAFSLIDLPLVVSKRLQE